MASLRTTIQTLAAKFATDIIRTVQSMSLDEILSTANAPTAARSNSTLTKRGRPSGQTAKGSKASLSVDAIVGELRKHKSGLRAENLRQALGVAKNKFNYGMAKAIGEKKIRKTGEKRGTTYFAR